MNDIVDIVHQHNDLDDILHPPRPVRAPVRRRQREDFMQIPDGEFKARLRFSKRNVRRLTDLLLPHLHRENNRGLPLDPISIVCSGLDILGGGHFQRVEGVCSNTAAGTAHKLLYK